MRRGAARALRGVNLSRTVGRVPVRVNFFLFDFGTLEKVRVLTAPLDGGTVPA